MAERSESLSDSRETIGTSFSQSQKSINVLLHG